MRDNISQHFITTCAPYLPHHPQDLARQPVVQRIVLRMSPCTMRAAFSSLPFWRAMSADSALLSRCFAAGAMPKAPLPPPSPTVTPAPSHALRKALDDAPRLAADAGAVGTRLDQPPPFRECRTVMELDVAAVSFVLCDDKPTTFGAPDALQVLMLAIHHALPGMFVNCVAIHQFKEGVGWQLPPCSAVSIALQRQQHVSMQ